MVFQVPHRVLIIGLGGSGLAAARLAHAAGAQVWVSDLRTAEQLQPETAQLPEGCRLFLGGHPEDCLEGVELVLTSPGVPPQAAILTLARSRGLPILTELELAWLHRPEAPLVAVTGSNGKSTVTVLVAEMLRAAGIAAVAGGNLGPAASQLALRTDWQAWVLEVSSFQSELLTRLRPRVGIFLNLSQDHLERHPDLDSYLAAKQRLFHFQEETDTLVLNADDPVVTATSGKARTLHFSLCRQTHAWLDGEQLVLHDEPLLPASEMALSGRHNVANALAAALAAHQLGAPCEEIASVLRSFQGLEHRHRTVLEHDGVRWVNDSKATNVGATVAGLQGYPASTVHLILGGLGKGQDFSLLAPEVKRAVSSLYLIGEDAAKIADSLAGTAAIQHCGTMLEAIRRARSRARPGDTVLLAPACASFDQFPNYGERGKRFAELVPQEVAACP